jgi:hypothetical protein
MNRFCCHLQHVVQCVLQHPRKKGEGHEKQIVVEQEVTAKESHLVHCTWNPQMKGVGNQHFVNSH